MCSEITRPRGRALPSAHIAFLPSHSAAFVRQFDGHVAGFPPPPHKFLRIELQYKLFEPRGRITSFGRRAKLITASRRLRIAGVNVRSIAAVSSPVRRSTNQSRCPFRLLDAPAFEVMNQHELRKSTVRPICDRSAFCRGPSPANRNCNVWGALSSISSSRETQCGCWSTPSSACRFVKPT